jgi:homopolymeric O-antigen transport system permease protein
MNPTVIVPSVGWRWPAFNEIWKYREILYFLMWRDIKVRYRQTALGAAWAILQPFLLMVVFSVFIGRLAHVPSNGLPYPVFAYAALVPWTFFAQAMAGASDSVVRNATLVSKIYFPRLILPLASAGSYLLDFAIAFAVLIGLMLFYGTYPTKAVLYVPVLTILALITAVGVGTGLAAVNVRYRDVRYAVPFLVQLWLFATPVAYPSTIVPSAWRTIYGLNPMVGVVEGFRWALIGGTKPPALAMLFTSTFVALIVIAFGLAYFKHAEGSFADVI